jgi:hypothetical protein
VRQIAALLVVLAAGCTAEEPKILSVSVLTDTRDTTGPYPVTIVASGVSDGDEIAVLYRVRGEDPPNGGGDAGVGNGYVAVTAQEGERDDLFSAPIPGKPAGSQIDYYAVAKRDGLATTTPLEVPLTFRVLEPSGFCRADSDCREGLEICAVQTCRAYQGTCVTTPAGLSCPGGYACDTQYDPDLCVIAPRACSNDGNCPAIEECDRDRNQCVARVPCEEQADCQSGYVCNDDSGLCFRQ